MLATTDSKASRKEDNMLGIKQNEWFKGNAKWVDIVQRHACTGIIC